MKNLKQMRELKGISQQKLADAVGSTQQSIHRYETGSYEPDIQTMTKIANYFDASIDYLVGNTEIKRKIEKVEKYELNNEEMGLVDKFRNLTSEHRKCLIIMLDALHNIKQT